MVSIELPVPDTCKTELNRAGKGWVFWKTNIHESNQHLYSELQKESLRQDRAPDLFAVIRGKIKSLLQKMEKHILWSFPLFWFIMSLDIWTCTVYIHVLALVKPLQCRSQFNWDLQICMTTQLMRFVIRSMWTLQWLFILCPSIAVRAACVWHTVSYILYNG